ncbi:MAG: GNAT family N-acetyltransferase [Anaerolineae bacterium]|jgi:GNAT superfamily N-acetyltransferase|nr:GNAT family N-acetyltransferase [Anaerolineae bacterium]
MDATLLSIRPALPADVPVLSEYWYDRMTLLMQTNPRIQLAADARARWELSAGRWLHEAGMIFLVAHVGAVPVGAIIGRVEAGTPGLLPDHYARVHELVIDLHTAYRQQGAGRRLLNAFRDQVRAAGITMLVVQVAEGMAVEQAFWRGMGARPRAELMWMDV